MKMRYHFLASFFVLLFSFNSLAASQATKITSNRFGQIFTTAAYSTALGGAVGTAVLAFTSRPAENLKFIAIGASIGFLSGTLLGGYLAFVPSFKKNSSAQNSTTFGGGINSKVLTVEAIFDTVKAGGTSWALHFPALEL